MLKFFLLLNFLVFFSFNQFVFAKNTVNGRWVYSEKLKPGMQALILGNQMLTVYEGFSNLRKKYL